jgi:hypothetical protein
MSWASTHPADNDISGNAAPRRPLLETIEINLIG